LVPAFARCFFTVTFEMAITFGSFRHIRAILR